MPEPGSRHAWPKSAACWSPAMPATGTPSKPVQRIAQSPNSPIDGPDLGQRARAARRAARTAPRPSAARGCRRAACARRWTASVTCSPVSLKISQRVDRAEHRAALPRALREAVDVAQQPLDLRPAEVRVEHEAGALADSGSWPGSRSSSQRCGGAPVLPDERAVQRLAGRRVPDADGLALVGDADRRRARPRHARVVERLAGDRARDVPDLGRVVLDPARPREVLAELAVAAADQLGLARRRRGRSCRSCPGRWRGSRRPHANRPIGPVGEPGCPSRPAAGLPAAGDSGSSHRRLPARRSCVRRRDRRHPAPSVRSGYGRGTAPNTDRAVQGLRGKSPTAVTTL